MFGPLAFNFSLIKPLVRGHKIFTPHKSRETSWKSQTKQTDDTVRIVIGDKTKGLELLDKILTFTQGKKL